MVSREVAFSFDAAAAALVECADKNCHRASSEQRPRTRSCHESERLVRPFLGQTYLLAQLRMLFQSTHEDRQSAEALAEPGERMAKSPLQRTLTAHIMSRWAKHEGALAHISLKRSIEMLELQCAQRFPARPADPEFSQSFFLPLSPNPHSLTCLRRRLNRCISTGTLLVFCRTFPRISSGLVSRLMFGRLFSAGVWERPSPSCLPRAQSHTLLLQDVY